MTARNAARPASGASTRERLSAEAARLFAERGYHGTSINDLAVALGIRKSSLYTHITGKADLLADIALTGAAAFHAALDSLPDAATPGERLELALRAHLGVVESQLDVATIWLQEWHYLTGEPRASFLKERHRYERRIRELFEAAVGSGELRQDLDVDDAVLVFFSVANWAYTWLTADTDVEKLASGLMSMLLGGMGSERSQWRRPPAHIISSPPATGTSTPVR
jgi:TetR/AcrR family transcriptional regulator, cholesterol catabolism regulator